MQSMRSRSISSFAIWYCYDCYGEKLTLDIECVTIGGIDKEYKGLYCAMCDEEGLIQISQDNKGLALVCREGCLRKYLQKYRSLLPLTIKQCNRYGLN